jgi:hypothetical protein
MTIDPESLRELAAERGFWPATTEEADIERHRRSVTVYPLHRHGREPSIRSNSTASSRHLEGNTTVVLLANFRFHRLPLRLSRSAEGSRLALARWLERITDRMEWSR